MLIDTRTKKEIVVPKIHGNKVIEVFGQKIRYGEWRRRARISGKKLVDSLKANSH